MDGPVDGGMGNTVRGLKCWAPWRADQDQFAGETQTDWRIGDGLGGAGLWSCKLWVRVSKPQALTVQARLD
jgi:hypothetical protein